MSEEQNNAEEREYTQQELDKMRKDTIAYYKNKISVLTVQAEHEELLARIAEAQLKQVAAVIRRAQLTAPPEEELENLKSQAEESSEQLREEIQAEKKPRSLKKD